MSPQPSPDSPWARPSADDGRPTQPPTPTAAPIGVPPTGQSRPGAEPISLTSIGRDSSQTLTAGRVSGNGSLSVIVPSKPIAPSASESAPPDPAALRRRTMRWFAGATGAVLAVGITVLLALVLTGHSPLVGRQTAAPDLRPELAKLCPPPSGPAAPSGPIPPTPAGPRTVDTPSGISYKAFGAPWGPLDQPWDTGGELDVTFRSGQSFVTEPFPGGGTYNATILSGSVPAATNDALTLDLKCTGGQVAADVRARYYPTPNTMDMIRNDATTLGGRPAWVSEFRLHFSVPGLRAKDELVCVALIDIGKINASILYISIPGTHKQYDYVIDQLLASVRPT